RITLRTFRIFVFIGSGSPVIEIKSDQRYPLLDAPVGRRHIHIGSPFHPRRRTVVVLVLVGPQEETVAWQDDVTHSLFEVRRGDRLSAAAVADVGDDRIPK